MPDNQSSSSCTESSETTTHESNRSTNIGHNHGELAKGEDVTSGDTSDVTSKPSIKSSVLAINFDEKPSPHPFVHWAQSQSHISLRVDLIQAHNLDVSIDDDSLSLRFSARGTGAHGLKNYFFSLTFHSKVEKKFECHAIERYVLIFLKKAHLGSNWPRLTKQAIKFPWLRVDFDRYTGDSDTDNSSAGSDSKEEAHEEEKLDFSDSRYEQIIKDLCGDNKQQRQFDNKNNTSIGTNYPPEETISSNSSKDSCAKIFAKNNKVSNFDIFNPFNRRLIKNKNISKMKYDYRKDTVSVDSSKNTAKHALDFRKSYLFLYNLVMFIIFLKVFIVLLVKVASGPVDDDIVYGTAFIVRMLTYAQLLESIHPMLGLVPGGPFMPLLQVSGRIIVNGFLINEEIRLGAHPYVHYLLIVWTCIEIFRYSYYALGVYKVRIYPLTWCRYSLFMPLYPCGGFCESMVLFSAIKYYEKTGGYRVSLPNLANISLDLPTVLRIYIYVLLGPTIYSLMKYMWSQRSKQLKEKTA